MRLPSSSRTFSPAEVTENRSGSARLVVMRSTSMAVHPATAASSSSTGVKSSVPPSPMTISPPRSLVTR